MKFVTGMKKYCIPLKRLRVFVAQRNKFCVSHQAIKLSLRRDAHKTRKHLFFERTHLKDYSALVLMNFKIWIANA